MFGLVVVTNYMTTPSVDLVVVPRDIALVAVHLIVVSNDNQFFSAVCLVVANSHGVCCFATGLLMKKKETVHLF